MVSMCVAYYFGEFSVFFKLFKMSPLSNNILTKINVTDFQSPYFSFYLEMPTAKLGVYVCVYTLTYIWKMHFYVVQKIQTKHTRNSISYILMTHYSQWKWSTYSNSRKIPLISFYLFFSAAFYLFVVLKRRKQKESPKKLSHTLKNNSSHR